MCPNYTIKHEYRELNPASTISQVGTVRDVRGAVRQACDTTLGSECEAMRIALQRCSEQTGGMHCQKRRQQQLQLVKQFLKCQLDLLKALHTDTLKLIS